MFFARVDSGLVVEVIQAPSRLELEQRYHPEFASACVACSSDVAKGWLYDGSIFARPAVPVVSEQATALTTLRALDTYLPRCVEDVIVATGIDETTLPEIMRERLALKRSARSIVAQVLAGFLLATLLLWGSPSYAAFTSLSATTENTFSTPVLIKGNFSLSISGTWAATVYVQRSFDNGATWLDVESYTENIEAEGYQSGAAFYRVGVKSGGYISGTVTGRIGQ